MGRAGRVVKRGGGAAQVLMFPVLTPSAASILEIARFGTALKAARGGEHVKDAFAKSGLSLAFGVWFDVQTVPDLADPGR